MASHTTVPAAAAASTDGAAVLVATATMTKTRKPIPSASSLYTGQATPAMLTSSRTVIG